MYSTDAMSSTLRLLNRLFVLHHRSFALYVADSGPVNDGTSADANIARVLRDLIESNRQYSSRLAEAILDRHGEIALGSYPMEFTDKNFLSLEYLGREMVEYQRHDIAEFERITAALGDDDSDAKELAQESLGAAKAHLEALEAATNGQPV
jgi:hypothetical protein